MTSTPRGTPRASLSGSNSQNADMVVQIANLTGYIRNWVLVARVTQKSSIREFSGKSGPGKLFSIVMADKSSVEIKGTFFTSEADKFYSMIEVGKIYRIKGGRVKFAQRQYNTTPHDYEITFDNSTEITPESDDDSIATVLYNFRKIQDIVKGVSGSFDFVGYVLNSDSITSLTSKKTGASLKKRRLEVTDQSNVRLEMTLWNEIAEQVKDGHGYVIAVKGCTANEYNGRKQIQSSNNAVIAVDPDIPETKALKIWSESKDFHPEELQETESGDRIYGNSTKNIILELEDEFEIGKSQKEYFNAIALVTDVISTKKLFYAACPNPECKYKRLSESSSTLLCERCHMPTETPLYRYAYSFKAADMSGSTYVNVIGDDDMAGVIFGMTAAEFAEKTDNMKADDVRDFVRQSIFKQYKMRFRASPEEYNGEFRVKNSLMHIAPLSYADEAKALAKEIELY